MTPVGHDLGAFDGSECGAILRSRVRHRHWRKDAAHACPNAYVLGQRACVCERERARARERVKRSRLPLPDRARAGRERVCV